MAALRRTKPAYGPHDCGPHGTTGLCRHRSDASAADLIMQPPTRFIGPESAVEWQSRRKTLASRQPFRSRCAIGHGLRQNGYVEMAVSTGGSVALPAEDMAGIGRLAYIKDPDGNLLGQLQPEAGPQS